MGKSKQRQSTPKPAPKAPRPQRSSVSLLSLLFLFLSLTLSTVFAIPFWCLTYSLALIYGRPPKMVYLSQTLRYLSATITSKDIISIPNKIQLILQILQHTMLSPVFGFCWLLDEILYGKEMNQIKIQQPLFVISAFRSASTQMARMLHQDKKRFVAPNAAMCNFPYLWFWKLVIWATKDGITIDEARGYLNKSIPKEYMERHESDPFAIDTFDSSFLSSHLNGLVWRMGPNFTIQEFNTAVYAPHNKHLFEDCFVKHVDRLARKTMLFFNATPDQHFLLKGHFLSSADALQRQFPDAKFLSVLRDPMSRIQSGVNYLAVNPTMTRPPNWHWLTVAVSEIEIMYSEREMDWYGKQDENRLAVRFDSFVKNTEGTMKTIYRTLLKEEAPKFTLPSSNRRSNEYSVNFTLQALGVKEEVLKDRFKDYYKWMNSK